MADTHWKTFTIDASQSSPEWFNHGDTHAHAELAVSQEDIKDLSDGEVSNVNGVDFSTDCLLYIASVGPDAGCDNLVVDDVTTEGERLTVDAHVECEAGMVAQVITYPATFLHVEDANIDQATVSVTDGWQDTHTITITPDN